MWLLLDTCFTDSVGNNSELVSNIQDCSHNNTSTVLTNGGSQTFSKLASLKKIPIDIHFDFDFMANILSLKDIALIPGARILGDSKKEREIISQKKLVQVHLMQI